ncbi:hypothetical protein S7335_4616 [Synechococcus sp. PCC 7335]|uniref:DUF4335 domain-containing protein n=1 Tax=Synechococcus sp. (strain ATCC 29403 / PCC 7335) TaxID=91464 RepID=UPI00017EC741|nr:DUF4335 domain-containing protein [Synechococcus sp. PCC 7335]EDX86909.1 hypothetical protein S7335_4616 [Synechococcus sp. PCC 7335]
MTIQRQYQLPNCSLILDGLSIDPTPGNEEVMSLLVNAECRISGLSRPLNGGYSFFAALVRAVSQYGQEVLSGYAHPQVTEGEPLLVHINPGDGPYHHLVVQPEVADLGDSGDGRAIDIKLSSVQLFDLTEAVDQFFSDTQTLPELEPALLPLDRRFVRTEEPLSDRALPAILGIGGLAAATMAIGLLSVPEVRDPALDARREEQAAEVATVDGIDSEGAATPEETLAQPPGETPDDSQAVSSVETVPETSEPNASEPDISNDTSSEPELAVESELTPETEPAADGALVAEPTTFDNTPPSATQSFAEVRAMNARLKDTIVENRQQPRFGEAISYRVRVANDGKILGYQPGDSESRASVDETPLPALVESGLEDTQSVDYRVVFTERGVVEVSPWWGWNYYN